MVESSRRFSRKDQDLMDQGPVTESRSITLGSWSLMEQYLIRLVNVENPSTSPLVRMKLSRDGDIGVKSMKRGEVAELVLRSDFGYGSTGSPPKIPPGATLVFEVELIDWALEDLTKHKDGGVRKSIITEGSGFSSPNDGATVKVTLTGSVRTADGSEITFDPKRDVCFIIGESSEEGLVEGLDIGVGKMKKGETAKMYISPRYGFKSSTVPRPACVPEDYLESDIRSDTEGV